MTPTDREIFDQSAQFYDLIYSDRDSHAETQWILNQLTQAGVRQPARILELGSGTGRHAVLFGEAGHSVTGVEPSPQMLERAQAHPRVKYVPGDARSIRIDEPFDAVLALFHVLSYHTSAHDIEKFFETVSAHLPSGGIFGFDTWFTPAVHALRPEKRTLTKESQDLHISRVATPTEYLSQSMVTVTYDCTLTDKATTETHSFVEAHHMRHLTETEIASLADQHGFEILDTREFLTGREASRETWGVWFTLRKI